MRGRQHVDDVGVYGMLQGACAIMDVIMGDNQIEHGGIPRERHTVALKSQGRREREREGEVGRKRNK